MTQENSKWRCRQSYDEFASELSTFGNSTRGTAPTNLVSKNTCFLHYALTISKNQARITTASQTEIPIPRGNHPAPWKSIRDIQPWFQGISDLDHRPHLVPRARYRRPKTPGVRSALSPTAGAWASHRWGRCHLWLWVLQGGDCMWLWWSKTTSWSDFEQRLVSTERNDGLIWSDFNRFYLERYWNYMNYIHQR